MIDTETTLDETQRLLFGVYRYLRRRPATPLVRAGWDCLGEGLIHADDVPTRDPDGYLTLTNLAQTRLANVALNTSTAGEPDWRLGLISRTEFAERWWYHLGVPHDARRDPAVIVFFNAPFDISRLAAGVVPARLDLAGGFSFQVMANADGTRKPFRPDVAVKQIDSKRALKKNRATETGQFKIEGYSGHYLDLRTAVFALTGEPHSLDSACEAYGVPGKSQPVLGVISPAAIEYCRNDVSITAGLFVEVVVDFEAHPIDLQLTKAYSPASIAKSYLDSMGIAPLLGPGGAGENIPTWILGAAMSAFYGGRAECHYRLSPVPVTLVDFTSMYSSVNADMGSWDLITAERIEVIDSHARPELLNNVSEFLNTVKPSDLYDKATWKRLLTLVEIVPEGDVLPVRAQYRDGEYAIGVNYFTDPRPHWYALADLVASVILTGKAPTVLRALTFRPVGKAPGLKPVSLRGAYPVDPSAGDFFTTVIEERQHRLRSHGEDDPEQKFLKVLANSGGYGIYAELNAQDRPAVVTLHAGQSQREPATIKVAHPEQPGRYCFPPLAAAITAAARLMLTLLEHEVASTGGQWVFCDTDSMAIITDFDSAAATDAASTADIQGLSSSRIKEIITRFNALNPYEPAVVPNLLKDEKHGMCLAISAKRYAIYTQLPAGTIAILKASEHGLGQLLDPLDPDAPVVKGLSGARPWIEGVWGSIIRAITSGEVLADILHAWAQKPAHTRLTISSPRLLRPFGTWNSGKSYGDQIKPANFMLAATIDANYLPPGHAPDRTRLIAPYKRNASGDTPWRNLYCPEARVKVTTEAQPEVNDQIRIKTYSQIISEYAYHPETKFLDATGVTCHRGSRGLLQRDHIHATRWAIIGKEANQLDEVQNGLATPTEVTTVYDDGAREHFRNHVLPVFSDLGGRQLAELTDCDRRTIDRIRAGQMPRRELYERFVALASPGKANGPSLGRER